jgi:hypothetical protein
MELAQPEIWTLYSQNTAVPAAFHALFMALENSREAI